MIHIFQTPLKLDMPRCENFSTVRSGLCCFWSDNTNPTRRCRRQNMECDHVEDSQQPDYPLLQDFYRRKEGMFLFLKQLVLGLFFLATSNIGNTDVAYRNTPWSLHIIRNNTEAIITPDKNQLDQTEQAEPIQQLWNLLVHSKFPRFNMRVKWDAVMKCFLWAHIGYCKCSKNVKIILMVHLEVLSSCFGKSMCSHHFSVMIKAT